MFHPGLWLTAMVNMQLTWPETAEIICPNGNAFKLICRSLTNLLILVMFTK